MSGVVSHLAGTARLAVLGRLDDPADQTQVAGCIAGADAGAPLQVDIYDADVLPECVVRALTTRIDMGAATKIIAYRPLLVQSLTRLDIPVLGIPLQHSLRRFPACRALALGGSANSLDKILHIIACLPESDTVVFIVQHVQETQPNLLDRLLRMRTRLRVLMPQHLCAVEAGTIYIAPPGHHLKVAHGLVYLTQDRKAQYARPSIDELFDSVAGEYGAHALAILLCGYGKDGVAGCAAIHKTGGCVLIEDASECGDACVLPEAAAKENVHDHVLACSSIASVVAAGVSGPAAGFSGELLDLFLEAVWQRYDHDFRNYQRPSIERRLNGLMRRFGIDSIFDFQRAVLSDPEMFSQMVAEISVSVTEFFRHPEQLRSLRDSVLPYLTSFPVIKVWSAGCATGEEPYSLAMLFREAGILDRTRLFATDVNPYLLELATQGLYPVETLARSRNNYLQCGGRASFDTHVEVCKRYISVDDEIRNAVMFHRHSLVDGGIFNEFQLIVCRNVMIYLDQNAQRHLLRQFAGSLHRDGFLVLGPKDGLSHLAVAEGYVPVPEASHIYRRAKD